MIESRVRWPSALCLFVLVAVGAAGGERPSVLVNPHVRGNGAPGTIQEGIELVDPGGKVMVLPGIYNEALVVDKALTLEAVGSGEVVVAPPSSVATAIEISGSDPVTIRGIRVEHSGLHAIGGAGAVDLTIENVSIVGALGAGGRAVIVYNNPATAGRRARLVVRDSFIDLLQQPLTPDGAPQFQNFGINPYGEVDSIIERNVVRRAGGACIFVQTNDNFTGETNADVVGNDLDECYPLGRAGSLLVGPAGQLRPSVPVTTTGTVNIVGNVIRNTSGSCRAAAGINFEMLTGRIEHNLIDSVVKTCALPGGRNLRAGIWIGSLKSHRGTIGLPPATPAVHFNDITGNAHAGLRVSPDQTLPVDAACNWWGSAGGPGAGDAVIGAVNFTPWAAAPIAGTSAGCT